MDDTPKRATYLYLQLTLVFSAVVWTLIIWSGNLYMGLGVMIPAIMWCPALSAMVTCRLLRRDFRSLAWCWPNNRYIAAAYFVPMAYASIAGSGALLLKVGGWNPEFVNLVTEDFGLRGLPTWGACTLYAVAMATGGVVQNVSTALGEEIGWRGFLVPELAKQMSFTKASLLSGIIWAAWHGPLFLFAGHNVGTHRWCAVGCSGVTVVSASFILAWFRLKSNSVWPAALLHASHNVFVAGIFDSLIRNTGPTPSNTSRFGAALAVTGAAFALYFWARRNEVEHLIPYNVSLRRFTSCATKECFERFRIPRRKRVGSC